MKLTAFGDARFDVSRFRSRPVIYDFGANRGQVCDALLDALPQARVMAFEPGPLRPARRPGLTLSALAVGPVFGAAIFHVCPEALQSSSLFARPGGTEALTVAVETLERLTAREPWIDAVSLDVEGAEWRILWECPARTLLKIGQLCVELHAEFSGSVSLAGLIERVCHLGQFTYELVRNHATRPVVLFVKRGLDDQPTRLRQEHNAWLQRRLAGRSLGRVLNLGCGTDEDKEGGHYCDYLGAAEIVKADLRPATPDVVQADAAALPFASGSFDLVFANWVVYKTDVLLALAEIRRVLRPGGEVMISVGGPDADRMEAIHRTAACFFRPMANWRLDYAAAGQALRGQAMWGVRDDAWEPMGDPGESRTPMAVVLTHWDDDVLSAGSLLDAIPSGEATVIVVTDKAQDAGQRTVFERLWKSHGHRAVALDIPQRTRLPHRGEGRVDYMQRAPRTAITEEVLAAALERAGLDLSAFATVATHDDIGTSNWHPQHRQLRAALSWIVGPGRLWLLNDLFGYLPMGGGMTWKRQALTDYGLRADRAPAADYLIPLAAAEAAQ